MENTPKKQITRKLCWWITEKCNENCVYCFRSLSSINRFTLEEHIEILKDLPEELLKNLAEGFILRYKNGKFIIDEELTEKSMNFELDFDNYKD